MFSLSSKNVLITGGAQGMGRLFAEKTLLEGGRVVLWDINETALNDTATELRSRGGSVSTYVVDVASVASIKQAADRVRSDIGDMDVLFNNAGIIVGKDFTDHSPADIERTLNINTAGPMHVTSAFLHGMLKNGDARIVNIASAAGLIPNPKMSVYAASKWAVIGWSESLRLEMERGGHDVKVTTVTPSYIDTGMFEGVKPPLLVPIIKPEKMADLVWEGMKKGKVYVRAPWIVGLLPFVRGIMPARVFDFIGGKLLRIYASMDDFKGHSASQKQPGTSSQGT